MGSTHVWNCNKRMFSIDTEQVRLQLEVVPVRSLSKHEEIIHGKADQLMLEFRCCTNLKNPVIVDNDNMVLDGHHRLFAFKRLGFNYISVCKLDYHNECVQLRFWFRHLQNVNCDDFLNHLNVDMRGKIYELGSREELKQELERHRFPFGIQYGDRFALVNFPETLVPDAVSAYGISEKLQNHLVERGARLRYVPCRSVFESESYKELKNDEVIICTPQISKEMVVEAVKMKKVFAPKTTRHLIPARPLNLNVPISWLKERTPLKDINKRFVEFLRKKKIKRFGPGQIINGRYYEEELFLFFD